MRLEEQADVGLGPALPPGRDQCPRRRRVDIAFPADERGLADVMVRMRLGVAGLAVAPAIPAAAVSRGPAERDDGRSLRAEVHSRVDRHLHVRLGRVNGYGDKCTSAT